MVELPAGRGSSLARATSGDLRRLFPHLSLESRGARRIRRAVGFGHYWRQAWFCLPAAVWGSISAVASGRWSMLIAPRVEHLHLLDPSPAALEVAKQKTSVTTFIASLTYRSVRNRSISPFRSASFTASPTRKPPSRRNCASGQGSARHYRRLQHLRSARSGEGAIEDDQKPVGQAISAVANR